MDQLKDVFSPKHSFHTVPSLESVYCLWHHLTRYEVSFLVNALLLEGDLARCECRLHWASDGCAILASNEEGL